MKKLYAAIGTIVLFTTISAFSKIIVNPDFDNGSVTFSKGFEIIGVAREKSSTDAMVKAIKRDGYPWLNLVELDDANSIRKKYHAGNGGGKIVMVDKDGTILAVDPSADEVEKILIEKLGEV